MRSASTRRSPRGVPAVSLSSIVGSWSILARRGLRRLVHVVPFLFAEIGQLRPVPLELGHPQRLEAAPAATRSSAPRRAGGWRCGSARPRRRRWHGRPPLLPGPLPERLGHRTRSGCPCRAASTPVACPPRSGRRSRHAEVDHRQRPGRTEAKSCARARGTPRPPPSARRPRPPARRPRARAPPPARRRAPRRRAGRHPRPASTSGSPQRRGAGASGPGISDSARTPRRPCRRRRPRRRGRRAVRHRRSPRATDAPRRRRRTSCPG